MKNLPLAGILLFCLVIPFIMTYGIGPTQTPYWLFGIIFGLLLGYLAFGKLRSIFLWGLIILVIGSACFSTLVARHRTAPIFQVHDIILQQEAAIRFLLAGRNPHVVAYFGTPLEQWHYSDSQVNPALFHFVMMPWYFLFALPFYFLSLTFLGFFDGRIPLAFLFAFLLILAWRLLKGKSKQRRLFLVILAFNPATLGYFLEGRADIFMFAFLFWGFYLLAKKRFFWAGMPLALAFATKQSAWPFFPFYLAFLYFHCKSWRPVLRNLLSFSAVFALVVSPFFFWDPKAFLDSTVFYLAGSVEHSYPIAGYGWGMVLHQIGVIKNLQAYYPFAIWQLAACLPLAVVLINWLRKSPTLTRLIFCYGIFTFVFWYFSRYFNNSHLGYLSMVFLTAYGFNQTAEKKG